MLNSNLIPDDACLGGKVKNLGQPFRFSPFEKTRGLIPSSSACFSPTFHGAFAKAFEIFVNCIADNLTDKL